MIVKVVTFTTTVCHGGGGGGEHSSFYIYTVRISFKIVKVIRSLKIIKKVVYFILMCLKMCYTCSYTIPIYILSVFTPDYNALPFFMLLKYQVLL